MMTNIQWIHTKEVRWNISNSLPSVGRQLHKRWSRWIWAGIYRFVFILNDQPAICGGGIIVSSTASFQTEFPSQPSVLIWWGLIARVAECWLAGLALVRGQACLPFPFSRVYTAERKHSWDKFTLGTQCVWQRSTKRHKISKQGSLCASRLIRTSVPGCSF